LRGGGPALNQAPRQEVVGLEQKIEIELVMRSQATAIVVLIAAAVVVLRHRQALHPEDLVSDPDPRWRRHNATATA
jgi:hypothetical protein